jgi:hypothetical protein
VQAVEGLAGGGRVGLGFQVRLAQLGGDPSWGDGVAPNVVGAEVDGHGAGHPVNSCLRRAVGRVAGVGAETFDRADVDDAPAAARPHVRQRRLSEEQRRAEVDGYREFPVFQQDLGDRALGHDPGVVDEDVDAAPPLDRALYRHEDRRGNAEIGLDVNDVRVARQGVVQRLALHDRDGRPFLEEAIDDAAAYPTAAAGHHGNLSF